MENVKLHKLLSQLKEELKELNIDSENYQEISQLISDIENQIEDIEEEPSLIERLQMQIEQFEVEHPKFTAILNDIMVKLSNMGI